MHTATEFEQAINSLKKDAILDKDFKMEEYKNGRVIGSSKKQSLMWNIHGNAYNISNDRKVCRVFRRNNRNVLVSVPLLARDDKFDLFKN